MDRRGFLVGAGATLGVLGATPPGSIWASEEARGPARLEPPKEGQIRVAVALSRGATVIDFAGPWEVFQDVHTPERGDTHALVMPFQPFTVAGSLEMLPASAGLKITPDYTFADAPSPHVVVVPAMRGDEALWNWLRKVSETADVIMSVCAGAFQLGRAGLLKGKHATTHHEFLDQFAKEFPDVTVERGVRLVDNGRIATAAGLTSGLDMALRVVSRYFGPSVAERTARYMEYEGQGWRLAG